MKTFTNAELKSILEKHRKHLIGEDGGERADLSGSDLSGSDLRYSNLRGCDLRYSNLSGKPILDIVQIGGIGSARRSTAAVILADACEITCGCFRGTLDEWRAKIEQTHAESPKYLAQYRAAVAFVEACAMAARAAEQKGEAT